MIFIFDNTIFTPDSFPRFRDVTFGRADEPEEVAEVRHITEGDTETRFANDSGGVFCYGVGNMSLAQGDVERDMAVGRENFFLDVGVRTTPIIKPPPEAFTRFCHKNIIYDFGKMASRASFMVIYLYMKKKLVVGAVCFILAGVASFFVIRFVRSGGADAILGKFFGGKGTVLFDESVPEVEVAEFQELFGELKLSKDVKLTYSTSETAKDSGFLVDIFVPTTDFYETKNQITEAEFKELVASGDASVISAKALDSSVKLLAVGENYFLDTFSSGAEFKYLDVEGEGAEDVEKVKEILKPKMETRAAELPGKATTLSLAQTGVTALARGMNEKLDEVGDATYFSEGLREYFKQFNVVHTSSESSFSEQASSANICSDPRFLETFLDLSLKVVELTGNHNVDCGADDALATIESLRANGISYFGGGENLEDARKPLKLTSSETGIGGVSVTMLGYNESTGGATSGEEPGANPFDIEDAREKIAEAKEAGDLVIVDIQYYECSEYATAAEDTTCDYADSSAGDQIGRFRSLVDMGADVVVGTSAHQAQTYEKYGEGEIYYGLGNLLFDQCWWPGTTRSLGLVHYFWNGKLIQTRRFGTVYDAGLQTRIMTEEEEMNFIERLNNARP